MVVHNVDEDTDEITELGQQPHDVDHRHQARGSGVDVSNSGANEGSKTNNATTAKARRPKNANRLGMATTHQQQQQRGQPTSATSAAANAGPLHVQGDETQQKQSSGKTVANWSSKGLFPQSKGNSNSAGVVGGEDGVDSDNARQLGSGRPPSDEGKTNTPSVFQPPPKTEHSMRLGGYHNPHSLPMKYIIGDLSNLRPELRTKYAPTDSIAALIPSGDRTATTRRPPPGVKVGDYITFFPSVEGLYTIVDFVKVDLTTPEGVDTWSKREGWSVEAAFKHGPQVSTGRTQMLYKRVA